MSDWATGFPFQQAFEHFMIAPQTTWDRFFNPVAASVPRRARGEASRGKPDAGRAATVDAFRDLSRQVDAAVEDYRGPRRAAPTLVDVERLLDGLEDLKRTQPGAYQSLLDR